MKNFQRCDRVSIVALSLSVFLGMLAFIPGGLIPSSILKGYLIVVCVLVSFVAWLLGRLIEGSFHIPWTPVLGAAGIFLVATFLSALFSHTPYLAFFGEGFDQGTFVVLGSLLLGLFLASTLFVTEKRVLVFLRTFFTLYVILALFQLVHVIFPTITSLNVFANRVDSPVGLWSDFAFLSGAMLVGAMLMLQFTKSKKFMKILLIVGSLLALFFVILANIVVVWILVGISSILILIYTLISNRFSEERSFPFLAFILSLIALLFVLANSLFGGILANYLQAAYIDVHPSIQATLHTSLLSLRHYPIFGPGPNSFLQQWLVYRPAAVNTSPLWDAQFSSGASLFGTLAVLGGSLGVIAALWFLFTFTYESMQKVFVKKEHHIVGSTMPIFGLFMIALYFLSSIIFFAPGIAVTVCAFIFIGIFIGALTAEKRIPVRELYFLKDQRASFFSILCIVALLMASAGAVYAATERFGAIVFYEKSLVSANNDNIDAANDRLSQAIALADLPLFERTRVLFAEQAIQETLGQSSGSASSDAVRTALQNAISTGNTAARNAINIDPSDPENYLALGDLLRLITPLKIDGVLSTAEDAYQHAITLAPNYPLSYLDLAELYYDSGDNPDALTYVQKAMDQKSNYTDAYFLLAQIDVSDGDTNTAIQQIEDATVIDPSNPDVYFELGLLQYNDGDYADAISAFNTTINLNNQYLNAWYYLALADQKTGDSSDATTILTALHTRLPDDQDVTNALNGTPSPATATIPIPTTTPPTTTSPIPATTPPATTAKQGKTKKAPLAPVKTTTGATQ